MSEKLGRVPELMLRGGSVITVDPAFRIAEAVAIADGQIVAVGSERNVMGLAGPHTRVVDMAGGAVMPGINDSHLHGSMFGAYSPTLWMESMAPGGEMPGPRTLDSDEDRRAALRRCWNTLLRLGITSYTEPGLGPGAAGQHGNSLDENVLRVYDEMARHGEVPVRVTALLLFGELDGRSGRESVLAGIARARTGPADRPNRWRVAGVKLFADGIPPMHTAWMREPYEGGDDCGRLLVDGADDDERLANLRAMIGAAHGAGLQIGVHATGDRSVAEAVRAFVDAADSGGPADPRHYLIHADLIPGELLADLARAGIGINAQPGIYTITTPMLDAAVGERRTDRALPLRSAFAAGVPACLSSDGPVSNIDWRRGIVAAVRRATPDGRVRGGDERIAVRDAIRAYTINGAWQDHAESWKGSIEPGKVADLCVLERSPLDVEVEQIPEIAVTATIIDGEFCYERPAPTARSIGSPRRAEAR